MALADIVSDVMALMPERGQVDEYIIRYYILASVREFSRDCPRILVTDIQGDGTNYDFALPSTYEDYFSSLMKVEYPRGEQLPTLIKPRQYLLYRNATTYRLRLIEVTPTTADYIRVTYTAQHSVTNDTSTIPDHYYDAFVDLALSKIFDHLGAKAAATQSSTLDADVVNYLSKVAQYESLSKKHFASYCRRLGKKEDQSAPPADGYGDWDTAFPWGADLITHPKSWR